MCWDRGHLSPGDVDDVNAAFQCTVNTATNTTQQPGARVKQHLVPLSKHEVKSPPHCLFIYLWGIPNAASRGPRTFELETSDSRRSGGLGQWDVSDGTKMELFG